MKSTFVRKPRRVVRIADVGNAQKDEKLSTESGAESCEVQKEKPASGLPGTRVSLRGGKEAVSLGHGFMDGAIGGGLGLGEVALIAEDERTTYYETLLRLYVAQGLVTEPSHECIVISTSRAGQSSLLPLPKPMHLNLTKMKGEVEAETAEKETEINDDKGGKDGQQKLKIAWRYDNNVKGKEDAASSKRAAFCNTFDLHKPMVVTEAQEKVLEMWQVVEERRRAGSWAGYLSGLLVALQQRIEAAASSGRVLRILLQSFATPLYVGKPESNTNAVTLRFLHALRGCLRGSTSVCLISSPCHLFNPTFATSLKHSCDVVCSFKSFKGESDEEVGPAYKDYHGTVTVEKLPRINTLRRHLAATNSYVFARKRHKLLVEVFSLPPELTRTTESASSKSVTQQLCATGPSKTGDLDF